MIREMDMGRRKKREGGGGAGALGGRGGGGPEIIAGTGEKGLIFYRV